MVAFVKLVSAGKVRRAAAMLAIVATLPAVSGPSYGAASNSPPVVRSVPGHGGGMVVTPDGSAVALRRLSAATDSLAVWTRSTGRTVGVRIPTTGGQRNGQFELNDVSRDGRFVILNSLATNIVAGDANNANDVFVLDRNAGTVALGSLSSSGRVGNRGAGAGAISADGRFLAFDSRSSNLVDSDTNGLTDVFVRDLLHNVTTRVSLSSEGAEGDMAPWSSETGDASGSGAPMISSDGRWVAFVSDSTNLVPGDTNRAVDVFLRDLATNSTVRVSVASDGTQPSGDSWGVQISGDGRYVSYTSDATNLVPDDTNGVTDAFAWDRLTGATIRVSLGSDDAQANSAATAVWGVRGSIATAISDDGRYVAFDSAATNLVSGDTNQSKDAFVRDRTSGVTKLVSTSVYGTFPEKTEYGSSVSSMSADGRYAVFDSVARNISTRRTLSSQNYLWDRDGTRARRTPPQQMRRPDGRRLGGHRVQVYVLIPGDGGWPINRFQARCASASAGSPWRKASTPKTSKGLGSRVIVPVDPGPVRCQVRAHNRLGSGLWSKVKIVR